MHKFREICVYCGSSSGGDPAFVARRDVSGAFSPKTTSALSMAGAISA